MSALRILFQQFAQFRVSKGQRYFHQMTRKYDLIGRLPKTKPGAENAAICLGVNRFLVSDMDLNRAYVAAGRKTEPYQIVRKNILNIGAGQISRILCILQFETSQITAQAER